MKIKGEKINMTIITAKKELQYKIIVKRGMICDL